MDASGHILMKYMQSSLILTSNTSYDDTSKLWRDILDQSKVADENLKKLVKDQ